MVDKCPLYILSHFRSPIGLMLMNLGFTCLFVYVVVVIYTRLHSVIAPGFELRNYSGEAQGTIWDAKDIKSGSFHVGHMQGDPTAMLAC